MKLLGGKQGKVWLIVDCCGLICASFVCVGPGCFCITRTPSLRYPRLSLSTFLQCVSQPAGLLAHFLVPFQRSPCVPASLHPNPLSPWAHSVFWVSFHSYAIILTADLGLLQTLAFYSAWDYANFALLQCLLLMSMWCHLATMLTDPGGEFHHQG